MIKKIKKALSKKYLLQIYKEDVCSDIRNDIMTMLRPHDATVSTTITEDGKVEVSVHCAEYDIINTTLTLSDKGVKD